MLKRRRLGFHRRARKDDELRVSIEEVLDEPCRMCRADVGDDCVPHGHLDRTFAWRIDHPHNLRIGDARETKYGRRW